MLDIQVANTITLANFHSYGSRDVDYVTLQTGIVWDESVRHYEEVLVVDFQLTGLKQEDVDVSQPYRFVAPLGPMRRSHAQYISNPRVSDITSRLSSDGKFIDWKFVLDFKKMKFPVLDQQTTIYAFLDVGFYSDQNRTDNPDFLQILDIDVGKAVATYIFGHIMNPRFVAQGSMFAKVVYAIAYKTIADFSSGVFTFRIDQASYVSKYAIGYQFTISFFNSYAQARLALDSGLQAPHPIPLKSASACLASPAIQLPPGPTQTEGALGTLMSDDAIISSYEVVEKHGGETTPEPF